MIMPAILIVCTANQCRSPVAEALLRRRLTQQPNGVAWQVESAGTWASVGRSAHPQMQVAAAEVELDLSAHRARMVDDLNLADYDLILTMEQNHREALQVEFPAVRNRIYLLSEMIGLTYDIHDPIGGPLEEFRSTVREIDRLLQAALPRLQELATAQAHSTEETL
ncbi:MAG: hypothetical protein R3C14_24530 [Caldilineaceae bacterium]